MHCTGCNIDNSDDSRFCKSCGRPLPPTTSAAADAGRADGDMPDEERVRTLLEQAYQDRREGDTSQAVMHCREALRLRPNTTAVHALLVQLYETLGEHDLALHAQQRVVELSPESVADRVKLDDLRHARSTPAPPPYANARPNAGVLPWVALVVAGASLMFLGGLFVLQLQRRDAPTTMVLPPNVRLAPDAPSQTAAPTRTAATEAAGAGSTTTATPPTTMSNPIPYNWGLPQPIIVEAGPYPSQPRGTGSSSAVLPVTVRPTPAKASAHPAKSSKMLLPGDDGDGSQIVVSVHDPRHPDTNSQEPGQPVISVKTSSGGGDNAAAPTSHDARSYMAMGDTQRVSGEFDRAIASYKLALAGAGDDEGYVYQQIASCYQKRGDKDSAINNYQKAIGAYRHLVDSGRNVEDAQAGIRACESSIKTCNF